MARQASSHEIIITLNRRFPDSIAAIREAFDGLVDQKRILTFDVPGPLLEYDPASQWRCQAAERIRETFLADLEPDVVHIASLFEGWGNDAVTPIGHFDNRFITAITLYDLIPLIYKDTYLNDPVSRALYYRKLQSLKNGELLLAISEHSRQEAIDNLNIAEDRVVNISSAADDIFRPLRLSPEEQKNIRDRYKLIKPFLMYTGGIDYRKNIEGLIEAFSMLPSSLRADHQLAIVCKMNDTDLRRLQLLAKNRGLSPQDVIFTGFVSDDDLLALYNLTSLFVFPSLHEGFGLPALEAMSCGAPVIGSNFSSIPEVLGRADTMFNPKDSRDIAKKIESVLGDKNFQHALREHGISQAENFSWDRSAKRAISAFEQLHETKRKQRHVSSKANNSRPLLAYFSPLPPVKSGIADHSAELLPELARHYEIEIVSLQENIQDTWIQANFPIRSLSWFKTHAERYSRILYHFGNSASHEEMFDLLGSYPGVVVLHDFFLSGLLDHIDVSGRSSGAFSNALYESHGYNGLIVEAAEGRLAAVRQYPCNKQVLDQALGIIIHSQYAKTLAERWGYSSHARNWRQVPLLKTVKSDLARSQARHEFHFDDQDFVVCTFGKIAQTKLNTRIVEAWVNSPLADDPRCKLILVGEVDNDIYGKELELLISESKCYDQIRITGFVSHDTYARYLSASDMAIQLRADSRGETSASILDCLSYGIPTVFNANGSAAELPDNIGIKLPDAFSNEDLSNAITRLRADFEERHSLSQHALQYVSSEHHPVRVGEIYRNAIEEFTTDSAHARYQKLTRAIAALETSSPPNAQDLILTGASIAANRLPSTPRRLLIDISELLALPEASGLAICMRETITAMLKAQTPDLRCEPVYLKEKNYIYARQFTLGLLNIPTVKLNDQPIELSPDDAIIELRLDSKASSECRRLDFHGIGCKSFSLTARSFVHDVLANELDHHFADWLNASNFSYNDTLYFSADATCGFPGGQRNSSPKGPRQSVRKSMGISETSFVVAVVGDSLTQADERLLLETWRQSALSTAENVHLLFILDSPAPMLRDEATEILKKTPNANIAILDSMSLGSDYAHIAAADLAIHLFNRGPNTIHTHFGDALAYGIPSILRITAKAPENVGAALTEIENRFSRAFLRSQSYEQELLSTSRIASIYRDHLMRTKNQSAQTAADENAPLPSQVIAPVTAADTNPAVRQLMIDVSSLSERNLQSGIQRVVHRILLELLHLPIPGYQVRPVRDANGHYVYANRFANTALGKEIAIVEDTPVIIRRGDIFLGLDLFPPGLQRTASFFDDMKKHGVNIIFVVYDLLPILRPDNFPKDAQANFEKWLRSVTRLADGLLCISRSVADELKSWLTDSAQLQSSAMKIGYFHLGADIESISDRPSGKADSIPSRTSFLMVGTVEPRKGHAQALAAFEQLWERGIEVELGIVGRQGWMVEELASQIRKHSEYGKRLYWFENADDSILVELYAAAPVLLLASEGEGFGLPLVEAAKGSLPVIARDLPVFREVAGDHAYYFSGTTPHDLAAALESWLALNRHGCVPSSSNIKWLTWAESARQLLAVVLGNEWYSTMNEKA